MKSRKTNLRYAGLTFAAGALSLAGTMASADQQILDDLIVDGSACVGFDCVNGESFGFDTIRMKENNVRLHFNDTSNSASFPSNDWRIVANDSSNGGGNYLAIEDSTAGRQTFRVEAGARTNALFVKGSNVGFGTNSPVVSLHAVSGNTPTLRLEQDGSSGFTAQTWDLAGNEANFFVRDVTNGSQLAFRIEPGADTNSLVIDANNSIGIGTNAPATQLHVSGSGNQFARLESTSGNAVQFQLESNGANRRIIGQDAAGVAQSQIQLAASSVVIAGATTSDTWATIDASGITLPTGSVYVPDYVFAQDYELMPLNDLRAFIAENQHLPNVPSAAEVGEKGLNMTRMQLAVLEKVEELTLYTLEQQKKIDALEAQLEMLAD